MAWLLYGGVLGTKSMNEMMNNNAISFLVTMLRSQNYISDLEKDIIDTFNELNKTPFDLESAMRQEYHNRITYLDIQLTIMNMPTTVVKKHDQLNMKDLVYALDCQFKLLMVKRFGKDWEIAQC